MRTENAFILFAKHCGDNPSSPEMIAKVFLFWYQASPSTLILHYKSVYTHTLQICPD